MARVEVADHAGACFGVERALKLVRELRAQGDGALSTLGPLTHNPRVVAELEADGVRAVAGLGDVEGGTLVLRTHGVEPAVEREACARGLSVVDATCPFVKRVHKSVALLAEQGYGVVVVGDAAHPEVQAIVGYAPGAVVVAHAAELDALTLPSRVGVVAQTTLIKAQLDEVLAVLTGRVRELRVFCTICQATAERQQAAVELAGRADAMVVLGGRNSANTAHLASLCAAQCARTFHVESPDELDASSLAGCELVGVTAGASTPAAQIAELVSALEELA